MLDSESVTVQFFVGAGGRYEDLTREYGAAHYLEHILFKGTHKRPSAKLISEEVDSVGGYMNAYTALDHTSYYIKVPKNYTALALNILSDIITDPLLEAKEIERERSVIIEEIRLYEDDPARNVYDLVGGLLWPGQPMSSNVVGTEHSIGSIQQETIQDYFNGLYTMDNMLVSVAGNVTHQSVVEILSTLLLEKQSKTSRNCLPVKGELSKERVNHLQQDTSQAHIVLAARGPQLDSPDKPASKVLATILGGGMSSRLFLNLRESKSLVYDIDMTTQNFADTGKLQIYAGVTLDKVEPALEAIYDELSIIQHTQVDERELRKAKEQVRGRMIMALESNSATADWLGTQLLLQGRVESLAGVLSRIDQVTPDDILRVSQEYLSPEKLRLAVIAPYETERIQKLSLIMEK